jgi:undecaprenyl diphosphate synthase
MLTEQSLADHFVYTGMPDPDLVVRTGGEFRLSNFLIWQAAYSEYYSTASSGLISMLRTCGKQ